MDPRRGRHTLLFAYFDCIFQQLGSDILSFEALVNIFGNSKPRQSIASACHGERFKSDQLFKTSSLKTDYMTAGGLKLPIYVLLSILETQ